MKAKNSALAFPMNPWTLERQAPEKHQTPIKRSTPCVSGRAKSVAADCQSATQQTKLSALQPCCATTLLRYNLAALQPLRAAQVQGFMGKTSRLYA